MARIESSRGRRQTPDAPPCLLVRRRDGVWRPGRLSGPSRRWAATFVATVLLAAWQVLRLVLCALLVLAEPLLRLVLVPIAFLGFAVTLLFGFALQQPGFPKWGMLAFSVGNLLLYALYLCVMQLLMGWPRDRH